MDIQHLPLSLLNYFFFAFHTCLMLFNTFGWIFRKTRFWNLITLSATAFSWFVLGAHYGWGYCFCTDWHWQVREKLGYFDQPNSYVKFLILKLTGYDLPAHLADNITLIVFLLSLILSLIVNVIDYRKRRMH
ncbi:MAG TPA: DUF2784 domain-containing protein [Daejeonella sp.]|nr:DUF2784 domain-containing protein [Daejeonella sp.]